jgi:hypothetical protein
VTGSHDRLRQGKLIIPDGDEGNQGAKFYGADGTSRWIARLKLIDDRPVDFSVGLQKLVTAHGWVYVARLCTAHKNYHLHQWQERLPHESLISLAVLDTLDDVENAMMDAEEFFRRAGLEVRRWRGQLRNKRRR